MFNWTNPYPTPRTPIFARNIVSTSQPLAAQAGLRVMARGGNAVDAAIAAAAVITMTEPCSNGLGADAFAIVWDGTQLHGLNASGISPAGWTLDYFRGKYGDDVTKNRPSRGADTITVPGAVAGWSLLHAKLGRLPFADVLAPAIDYAERGFAISPNVHDKWTRAAPILKEQPGWAEHFLPGGKVPAIGQHFTLAGAARTLKAIAESRSEAYYRGDVAHAIAAHVQAHGGAMTAADLEACWRFIHSDGWVDTIAAPFAGHMLHEIPPNGQGIAALGALGLLRHTDLADVIARQGVDAPETQHLMIEAMKLAFADTYAFVADARSMRMRPADMLDDAYLRERARLIDPRHASAATAGAPPRGGTIYLATADAGGMMVSFIQSNYMGFGSGLVVPGYGISLQNRGHGFSMDAASPNVVAPHKRPFHTIIPAFLMKDGQPRMSFGVMGGNMQPQGHVQTLVRMLLGGQQPQAACDAPRWKAMEGLNLEVEATMPTATVEYLRARGHRIISGTDTYMDFGAAQLIWRLGDPAVDGYVAASDPRRDGQAVGY
jgi:gamma-glutamyltranspeptidase/glutathione hydrolase